MLVELGLDQPERQPRCPDLLHPRPPAAGTAGRRHGPRGRASAAPRAPAGRGRPGRRSRGGSGRRRGARRAGTRGPRRSRPRRRRPRSTVMFLPTSPRPPSGMIFRCFQASTQCRTVRRSNGWARRNRDTRLMRLSMLAYATVAAGLGVTVAGAFAAAGRPLTALALFGAAALAAELLEEPESARIREPVEAGCLPGRLGRRPGRGDRARPVARRARRGRGRAGRAPRARFVASRGVRGLGVRARLRRRRLRLRPRRWPCGTPHAARRPRPAGRAGARLPARLAACCYRSSAGSRCSSRISSPPRQRPASARSLALFALDHPWNAIAVRAGRTGRQPRSRARPSLATGDAARARDLRQHRRRARPVDLPAFDPRGRLRRLGSRGRSAFPTRTSTACAGRRGCTTSARLRSTQRS